MELERARLPFLQPFFGRWNCGSASPVRIRWPGSGIFISHVTNGQPGKTTAIQSEITGPVRGLRQSKGAEPRLDAAKMGVCACELELTLFFPLCSVRA